MPTELCYLFDIAKVTKTVLNFRQVFFIIIIEREKVKNAIGQGPILSAKFSKSRILKKEFRNVQV